MTCLHFYRHYLLGCSISEFDLKVLQRTVLVRHRSHDRISRVGNPHLKFIANNDRSRLLKTTLVILPKERVHKFSVTAGMAISTQKGDESQCSNAELHNFLFLVIYYLLFSGFTGRKETMQR